MFEKRVLSVEKCWNGVLKRSAGEDCCTDVEGQSCRDVPCRCVG